MRAGSRPNRTRDHREKDIVWETRGVCNNGKYSSGEALPVLYSQDQACNSSEVHRGEPGSMETFGNSVFRDDKGEVLVEASMELEGYRG